MTDDHGFPERLKELDASIRDLKITRALFDGNADPIGRMLLEFHLTDLYIQRIDTLFEMTKQQSVKSNQNGY